MSVLAQYSFPAKSLAPSTTGSNLSAGNVTNGSLTTCVGDTPGYASDPTLLTAPAASATSEASAVSHNSYFLITITPNSGYKLNLTSLTFNAARGGSGTPRGYGVRSSIDSYASDIATADLATVRTTWTAVSVDLSGSNFQNLTSAITFRIYVYAPSTTNNVDFDDITLNGSAVLLSQTITPSLVTSSHAVYAPTVKGKNTLSPGFLSRTALIYSPTITTGPVTLTPAFISRSPGVYLPSVKGANTLTPSFITRSPSVYLPALASEYTIATSLVSSAPAVYLPTPSEQDTLVPDTVVSAPTIYAPSVINGTQTIAPALIVSSNGVYAPSIKSLNTINPSLINRIAATYLPVIGKGAVTISPSLITSSPTVYSASIAAYYNLSPGLVSSLTQVFPPTLGEGAATINAPFINHIPMVYVPTVVHNTVHSGKAIIMLANGKVAIRLSDNLYLPA